MPKSAQSTRSKQAPQRKPSKRKKPPAAHESLPQMPPRIMVERTMAQMFGAKGGGAEVEAQDLAYAAMEAAHAGDFEQAVRLAMEAVELHIGCVDAQLLLAQLLSETPEERIEAIQEALEIAELELGPEFFEEHRGHFWGILETRPYMRARAALAELLTGAGRTDEAITHYEDLLALNPDDNQGLRYALLGLYLEAGRLGPATTLFEQFEGEWSAMFKWSRVLERFLNGDPDGARAALDEARQTNAHVERFLTGRKSIPREMPAYYSPGQESEALICIDSIGRAWQQHPDSIAWLKEQAAT